MANNTAKSVTLTDKNTNEFLYPYTSDSLVKRTNSTYETVQEALDALEAGGAATNRAYDSTKNVQGYMVLNPSTSSASVASQLQGKENYIIEIRDIIDLNDTTLTIPEGCTLKFVGGKIINGTLVGTDTVIDADPVEIFGDDVSINGTWDCDPYAEWFDDDIQMCLDQFKTVNLLDKEYTVTDTIQLPYEGSISGNSRNTVVSASGEFPIFNLGYMSTVQGLQVYVEKPCTVFWINTQHYADTYWGRKDEDAAYGRPLTNTKRDFGWANDPKGANRPNLVASIYVHDVVVRCNLDYKTATLISETSGQNALHDPSLNGPCIYIVSDGNYISRHNSVFDGFSNIHFDTVSIGGPWHYCIRVETGTVEGISYGSIVPWLTDCTFDDIKMWGCYNCINVRTNNAPNVGTVSTGPGYIRFNDVSSQLEKTYAKKGSVPGDYGCIFADIEKSSKIFFNNCIPWDWSMQGFANVIAYKFNRDLKDMVYLMNSLHGSVPVLYGNVRNVPYVSYSNVSLGAIEDALEFSNYGEYSTSGNVSGTAKLFNAIYDRYPIDNAGSGDPQEDRDYNTWVNADTAEQNLLPLYQNKINKYLNGYAYVNNAYWNYNGTQWSKGLPDFRCKNLYLRRLPYGTFYFNISLPFLTYMKLDSSLAAFTTSFSQSIYGIKTQTVGGDVITLHFIGMRTLGAEIHLQPTRFEDRTDPKYAETKDAADIPDWTYFRKDQNEFVSSIDNGTVVSAFSKMADSKIYGTGQINFMDNRIALCKSGTIAYDANGMNFNPIVGPEQVRLNLIDANELQYPALKKLSSTTDVGKFFFDTTSKLPYWYDGTNWVSWSAGTSNTGGPIADKPSSPSIGTSYFITDEVVMLEGTDRVTAQNIPLFYNGTDWSDVEGTKHTFDKKWLALDILSMTVNIPDLPEGTTNVADYRVSTTMYTKSSNAITEITDNESCVTDLIPVVPGMKVDAYNLRIPNTTAATYPFVICFDSSEQLITDTSKAGWLTGPETGSTKSEGSFTIPAGVSYIKLQFCTIGGNAHVELDYQAQ